MPKAKKGKLENSPSQKKGKPSGKGRANNPPKPKSPKKEK
jgi:hypothetical protein